MAITPPIMVYPLGTDYYDVEVFNTNWKNSLTYLDNNFLNNERVLSEQLSTSTTNVLSTEASNKLFENGVGADVLGYIEDGATHTAGTVWLSKFNKGEFKCLTTNTDDFIDTNKWFQIDDLTNASKLEDLTTFSYSHKGITFVFTKNNKVVTVSCYGQCTSDIVTDTITSNLDPSLVPADPSMREILFRTYQQKDIYLTVDQDLASGLIVFDSTSGLDGTIPAYKYITGVVSYLTK